MSRATDSAQPALGLKLHEAVALHQRGHLSDAKRLYREILREQPNHFDALHLLGVIAAASGDLETAADLIGQALEIDPNRADAHNNRGNVLLNLFRPEAAAAEFARAIELKGDYADAHYNRGIALTQLRQWEAALASYDRVIALKRAYPEAWSNRGIVLAELQRWDAALSSYDAAIQLRSDFAQAHFNRANVLCRLRQWDAALAGYERAIAIQGDYAEAHCNRGFVLHALEHLDEALACCDRAIGIRANYAEAHCNRATVLLALRRFDDALSSYDLALALKPDYASARVNRALGLLSIGRYEQGWEDYEWRWQDETGWVIHEKRHFPQPQWSGRESLRGKTILLHSEQGYGDTLQFCRYAGLVAALDARVILEVPRALAALLETLPGVAQVVVQGEQLPPFDYYCPLLSLPLAMRTSLATIPCGVPYLAVDAKRRDLWRTKLGERRRPRVGLVWSGGFRPSRPELWSVNARRNVPLENFAALADIDVDFYSLQTGEAALAELAALSSRGWGGPALIDLATEFRDFADTAALIDQLDLVISVDTAVAHLAGAMGKPVWILNRFDGCWRWLLDRDDSPWYPTARLFRQERPGDWRAVLDQVRDALRLWVSRQANA